jgi:hypothetical protein
MGARFLRRIRADHWAERRRRIERVAQLVLFRQLDEAFDELVVNILMNIDALNGAADWPELNIAPSTRFSIVAAIGASGRTYAGSLPPSSRPVAMNRSLAAPLHGMAARDRTREGDETDPRIFDHFGDLIVVDMQELKDSVRQARGLEGLGVSSRRRAASGARSSGSRCCPQGSRERPR